MTGEDFANWAMQILGRWGWQARMARAFGFNSNTISAWARGKSPVPDHAIATLELLETLPPEQWPARWKSREKPFRW